MLPVVAALFPKLCHWRFCPGVPGILPCISVQLLSNLLLSGNFTGCNVWMLVSAVFPSIFVFDQDGLSGAKIVEPEQESS